MRRCMPPWTHLERPFDVPRKLYRYREVDMDIPIVDRHFLALDVVWDCCEVSAVVRVFVRYITNLEDSFYHRLYQPVHPLDESVGYCIQLTMPGSVVSVAWQVVGGEKSGD